MKKANFDWINASKYNFDEEKYKKALEDLKKYEGILRSHPGIITGYQKERQPHLFSVIILEL
jgi:hypothetical protein